MNFEPKRLLSSLRTGWALLLFILILAGWLRFWQLGQLPPGLYRDEAYNGLDALDVLDGQQAWFFPANNGREPAYIYLTAVSVALFGRSALAVRLGAAMAGTLTTGLVYLLARSWYGRATGLLAAFTWAVTLWPVHLSRIGLRPILLAPFLAAAFWLGTLAYRRQKKWLWLLAGLVYGAGFYTYLAIRFTPLLLAALAFYLLARGKGRGLWPGLLWFGLGTAVSLTPFTLLIRQQPDILLDRTGQVSILHTAVNGGNLWGTVWQHGWQALGMFLWQGDTILRHNPAGRPLFDWFMAVPFLMGLGWCLRHWRRPAAMALLLWTAVMLGPTILAADTPHFLRASGLLPGVVILPAIGLAQLWRWERLPPGWRQGVVLFLMMGSLVMTIRDYGQYGRSADTGYLFEQAARTLAETVNGAPADAVVFMDDRFWSGWPSIPFLVTNQNVEQFQPESGLPVLPQTSQLIVWPYAALDFIPPALPETALVRVGTGPLHRGDLEPEAYPLYTRYLLSRRPDWPITAVFADQLALHHPTAKLLDASTLQIDLAWSTETAVPRPLTLFIHILGPEGMAAQRDTPPGNGRWPHAWWRPGLLLHDRHIITLPEPFDPDRHRIIIGLYDSETKIRLPLFDPEGNVVGDSWELKTDD